MGAVVTGQVRGLPAIRSGSWANPTSLLTGGLFVVTGAYLAAVYLAVDSERDGDPALRTYFVRRAVAAGARRRRAGRDHDGGAADYRQAFVHRTHAGAGLPLVVISVAAGAAVLVALLFDVTRLVRPVAALAVAAVVWGWAISQYPHLLPPRLTIARAAAPSATLATELVVVGIIVVLVIPSFALLFRLAQSGKLAEANDQPLRQK